mmetsp:Transcript_44803/g.129519  ORF Transcript_44803/g.129519 Transcript_44803/m.129519 type:complete len:90 (-) Transcript_44803:938-1207(-)
MTAMTDVVRKSRSHRKKREMLGLMFLRKEKLFRAKAQKMMKPQLKIRTRMMRSLTMKLTTPATSQRKKRATQAQTKQNQREGEEEACGG